jgi:hypothetical protein
MNESRSESFVDIAVSQDARVDFSHASYDRTRVFSSELAAHNIHKTEHWSMMNYRIGLGVVLLKRENTVSTVAQPILKINLNLVGTGQQFEAAGEQAE